MINLTQLIYTVICQIIVIPFRLVSELVMAIDSAWTSISGLYGNADEEDAEQPENSNNRHHVGFKQN